MRILQVNTLSRRGGAAKIANELHNACKDRGHQSWMAVGDKQGSDSSVLTIPNEEKRTAYARGLYHQAERVKALEGRIPKAQRLSRMLNWMAEPFRHWAVSQGREDFFYPGSWFLSELLEQDPDIIHCHNLHGGYFDLRVLAELSRKIPTVITLHDAWLLSGHCAHSLDCERWQSGCGACPYPSLYPAMERDASAWNWCRKRAIYRQSRLYIATPCDWLMKKVQASILAESIVDARVIPNGVDLKVFLPGDRQRAREALGIPQDVAVVLFSAHYMKDNPWKDYQTMRRVVEQVGKQSCREKVWFIALGEAGEDEWLGDAMIRFIPHQDKLETVVRYYQASDIYIHAAHAETFPNVILEAHACELPVVATKVGGIAEQIEDGITGFLVPHRDHVLMGNRVLGLLHNEQKRRRMGMQCRQVVEKKFSQELMATRYLDWYEDILCQRKRG